MKLINIRIQLTLVLIAALAMTFASCDPETCKFCPGMNLTSMQFFEYAEGDKLIYSSDKGNTTVFSITDSTKTFERKECQIGNTAPTCYEYAEFIMQSSDAKYNFYFTTKQDEQSNSDYDSYLTIYISKIGVSSMKQHLIDLDEGTFDPVATNVGSMEIAGISYDNVYMVEHNLDEVAPKGEFDVYKIYFAEKVGVVQYHDLANDEIWSLQP